MRRSVRVEAGADPTAALGHRVAATHSRCGCEANPDHDSTLKFGVATSGLVHQSHAVSGSARGTLQ
jgi:hypothetical protein